MVGKYVMIPSYNDYKLLPGAELDDRDPSTGKITNKFLPSDTRALYERNKKKHLDLFIEKNINDISYDLNSSGYRAPEWEDINWKESVVIFGCSLAFGIALPERETISYKLEKLLGTPVINLGVPGASITHTLHNNFKYLENFEIPKAVINLWSSPERFPIYREEEVKHHGWWSDRSKKSFFYYWAMDADVNSRYHSYFSANISRELWKSKTTYLEGTLFEPTSSLIKCHCFPTKDRGRDLAHIGPQTTSLIADYFYQKLK